MKVNAESVKIDFPIENGVIVGVCVKTDKSDDGSTVLQTTAVANFDDADKVTASLEPIGALVLKCFMDAISEASNRVKKIHSIIKLLDEADSNDSTDKDDSNDTQPSE